MTRTKRTMYDYAVDPHDTDPNMYVEVNVRCRGVGKWVTTRTPTPTRLSAHNGKTIEVWKKAYAVPRGNVAPWRAGRYVLLKLHVHARALRFQPRNGKCRASSATVVSIHPCASHLRPHPQHDESSYRWKVDLKKRLRKAVSSHDAAFVYEAGKKVKPQDAFDRDHRLECASGIHFFLTQQEALEYQL